MSQRSPERRIFTKESEIRRQKYLLNTEKVVMPTQDEMEGVTKAEDLMKSISLPNLVGPDGKKAELKKSRAEIKS